jgi:hypothetical protein
MKQFILILKLLLFLYLGYLVWFFLTTDGPADRGYAPPFFLWVLDTINLFIHEAGHLFLKPFGMWIYIFGGSFIQCFLPLLLAVVTWRQNPDQVPYAAFWFGENLINVSYYIRDAPYKHLRLLAAGLIHDWNWLIGDEPGTAETIGTLAWGAGILVCIASIGAGTYIAIRLFREDITETMDD